MLTDGPGGGVHSAGAATADREVLNQDSGDKPSDKAMTCSRSRLACRGEERKKTDPIAFTRLVELLKQRSLSARLKTGTSSMF